jgi:serine/threonine protein kinase
MSDERKSRSREHIFNEAAEIEEPGERAKFLDQACGDDVELRAEVEGLLRHDDDAGSFLEKRPEDLNAATDPTRLSGDEAESYDESDDAWLSLLGPSNDAECLGTLGPYRIIELIGRGGMGVVLRAVDPKLNRTVAVKLLAPELSVSATAVQRFLREARAAAAVSHDHVVAIHSIDDVARPPIIVMEFIDGQSVQQKIDKVGALDVKSILRIGMQTAAGLEAAHRQGLVHRDIKPANILLENGIERVKLTDFGLARAIDDIGMTKTGQITGTPQYMSPEQAQGQRVDHRTDLFSLGCVLYAMCTGGAAFRADSAVAVMHRIVHEEPRPVRQVNEEVPDWLCRIVEKLLEKRPQDRFESAEEVEDLLGQHLAHLQQPDSVPMPKRVGPSQRTAGITTDAQRESASGSFDTGHVARNQPQRRPWRTVLLLLLALCFGFAISELAGGTHALVRAIDNLNGHGRFELKKVRGNVKVRRPDGTVVREGLHSPNRIETFSIPLFPGEYEVQFKSDEFSVTGSTSLTLIRGGYVSLPVPDGTAEVAFVQDGPVATGSGTPFAIRQLDPVLAILILLVAGLACVAVMQRRDRHLIREDVPHPEMHDRQQPESHGDGPPQNWFRRVPIPAWIAGLLFVVVYLSALSEWTGLSRELGARPNGIGFYLLATGLLLVWGLCVLATRVIRGPHDANSSRPGPCARIVVFFTTVTLVTGIFVWQWAELSNTSDREIMIGFFIGHGWLMVELEDSTTRVEFNGQPLEVPADGRVVIRPQHPGSYLVEATRDDGSWGIRAESLVHDSHCPTVRVSERAILVTVTGPIRGKLDRNPAPQEQQTPPPSDVTPAEPLAIKANETDSGTPLQDG